MVCCEKFVSGEEGFEALGRGLNSRLAKEGEGAQRQSDLENLEI